MKVPELEWTVKKDDLLVRWSNCVAGFNMPAVIMVNGEEKMVPITDQWSSPAHGLNAKTATLRPDRNWYVTSERVDKKALKKARRK